MNIKIARIEDFEFLATNDIWVTKENLEKKIQDKEIYIAYINNSPIGWLRYGYFWDSIPFMNMLRFLEEYRGKGYGKSLVLYWEQELKAKGFKLAMTSTAQEEFAQHFYAKLGYKSVGGFTPPSEPYELIFAKEI